MRRQQFRLTDMQKRLFWFLVLISGLGLGAGFYFKSRIYFFVGLLAVGVLIGGLVRWLLERFRPS